MNKSRRIKYDNIIPKTFSFDSKFIDFTDDKKLIQNSQVSEVLNLGKKRLSIFSYLIFILMALLIVKSFKYSTKNYLLIKLSQNKDNLMRGMILDRNNNVISGSIPVKDLYLEPNKILDNVNFIDQVRLIFPDIKIEKINNIIKSGKYRLLKKHLSKTEEVKILKLGEPALKFQESQKRIYPQNNLFSQVTGFVSKYGVPKSKLEKSQNQNLEKGQNIYLTLDAKLQNIFYEELKSGMEKFNARAAAAIMMDVNTGEIITMLSLPDYNPNFPNKIKPFSENNLITSARYEMGSTLKTFNVAMALQGNISIKNQFFDVSKPYRLSKNYLVHDVVKLSNQANLNDIFVNSSNIGSIKIFDEIGHIKQKEFFSKLKLDKNLQIEGLKIIRNRLPEKWNQLSGRSLSFGYGASLTPISLVSTYALLVNGGYYVQPKILKNLENKKKRIFSETLSKEIRDLLHDVVINGSGKKAYVNGIDIGGKTGTARKTNNKNYGDKVITSFVGVFPITKPKYIIFILLDEPQNLNSENLYGGNTAAPIFSRILKRIAIDIKIYPKKQLKKELKITKKKSLYNETF